MRKGFTLIELSIVLVIIGLIVGGVLVGQDLIRQAQLRKSISEHQMITTAVNAFRLKYNGYPGDLNNAATFWSGARNGNGDRQMTYVGATDHEGGPFWHHLSGAGLISGTYPANGVNYAATSNNFRSALRDAYWHITYTHQHTSTLLLKNNWLAFMDSSGSHSAKILRPIEAYDIDTKIDDGMPQTGKVLGQAYQAGYDHSTCVTTAPFGATSTYVVTSNNKGCVMFFKMW